MWKKAILSIKNFAHMTLLCYVGNFPPQKLGPHWPNPGSAPEATSCTCCMGDGLLSFDMFGCGNIGWLSFQQKWLDSDTLDQGPSALCKKPESFGSKYFPYLFLPPSSPDSQSICGECLLDWLRKFSSSTQLWLIFPLWIETSSDNQQDI